MTSVAHRSVRKFAVLAILAIIVAIAAVYLHFADREYTLRLSESALRSELETRAPFVRSYFLFLEVTLDNPRIVLVDRSDRVQIGFDAMLDLNTRRGVISLQGEADVSGGIRYDPERGELYLTDPLVERSSVRGVRPEYEANVNDALGRALTEYLRTQPIYTLRSSDVRTSATRLLLRNVAIEEQHLVLSFGLR